MERTEKYFFWFFSSVILLLTKWLRNDASTIARWWHGTIKPHMRGITVNNCKTVYFHKARVNHNKFLSVPRRTEQTSFFRSTSRANKPNEKAVDVEVWKVFMLSAQLKANWIPRHTIGLSALNKRFSFVHFRDDFPCSHYLYWKKTDTVSFNWNQGWN